MNISRQQGWDLQETLRATRKFQRCYAMVRITDLVAAANIRPVLPADEQMWYEHLHKGFDSAEHYIRAYVDAEHADALTELVKEHKYDDDVEGAPRPFIGRISAEEMKLGDVKVVDGAHRTTGEGALRKRHKEWLAEHQQHDPDDSPFLWVKVLLYTHDILPTMSMLAKACNDETGLHVPETLLSRYTLIQRSIDAAPAGVKSQKQMTNYILKVTGIPEDKRKAKANFHSQLVGIAMSIRGELTTWLIDRFSEHQKRHLDQA